MENESSVVQFAPCITEYEPISLVSLCSNASTAKLHIQFFNIYRYILPVQ